MYTARLLTHLPIIMGLSSAAALLLILVLSISPPLTSVCIYPSRYSFPEIKSVCVEYVCSMRIWSLLSRLAHHSTPPIILITPRNIFLLVNLIIVFLFISMHLQRHAPAADKRSLRKKRQQLYTEKLKQATAPLQPLEGSSLADHLSGSATAAMPESEALSCAAEMLPRQASMESLDSPKGSDAERIEDGRLRLIESINGSDEEKIVLEEDGRLRLIDRPLPSNSSRPEKSLSDNCYPNDNNHNVNYDTQTHNNFKYDIDSLNNYNHNLNNDTNIRLDNNHNVKYDTYSHNNFKYDIDSLNYNHSLNNDTNRLADNHHDNYSPNNNHSNLNEGNNGILALDYNSNPILSHNLNHDDAHHSNTSSSVKRNYMSRPTRVKKSESLDATWKAINQNKGSAINGNTRDHKHLIRQSSRQDFKPSSRGGGTRGLMAAKRGVRREPSIGQEELNAKVESFIAKFNEQIRIERQQSMLSFMQMVDRGA